MKTIKQIILAGLVLLFALGNCLAQDDVYNDVNNHEKREKTNNKKINTGYVFIDGKYVEPPYTVKRKKCGIYINNIKITKCHLISDKRTIIKIRKDPGSPKNIAKMDSINVIFRDTILEYNINYVLANYYYYYGKYSDDKAMRLMKEFFQGLPNIKSVEGEETLHVTAWNGDIKMLSVRPPVPIYNKLQKKRHLRYNHNLQVDMFKERFIKGGVSFIFPDDKTLDGYAQISFGATIAMDRLKKIYEILVVDTISNETKVKQLKENVFFGNSIDKYLDVFIENMDTLVLKEILENNHTLTYTECDNFDKIGFISDTCMRLKDPESEIAFSPKSNFVNIGCPAPWGSVFLGLNPSFETVSQKFYELVEHQGYNDVCYNIDLTNNDVQTGSLTYENFKNFCAGGVNLWMSHGVKSTTNMEGYIQVAYFNSTENDIDLVLQDWFGGNDMSGFGVIEAINPNENNWGGDTPPFILVAYPEVASNLWKPKVNTYNSITMISSCYSYQNGFVQACGTNGATLGYNDVVMGITTNINNKALLKRLNGTKSTSGNYFRNTSLAYNNYPFSNLIMYPPNANITLCPATKSFYPENNETVPPTVTIGYFEVDTWCDASIPASEALTFETKNGNIDVNENNPSDLYWADVVDGKSNMIVYKWTGYGRLQVNVHTDKIIAYGGGGQELDFDKKTPNGEEGVFYVFNVGYDNPTYVNFTADYYMILENSEVQFTDISTINEPQSYHWNFGDGGTSSLQNPVHTYYDEGSYDVTLTIATPEGNLYEYKPNYITVSSECDGELYCTNNYVTDKTVEFYASITGIFEPLVDEYRYTFDFGDGHTETFTDNSPFRIFEYDYTEYGTYETKVIVEILSQWGEVICIKECSCNTVELYDPFPCSDFHADFSISPNVAYLHGPNSSSTATVNFYNITSGGNNYVWIWNFYPELENGFEPLEGLESEQYVQEYGHSGNTSKTYTQSGIYPVTLTVLDENGCSDSETRNVIVSNPSECVSNLRILSKNSEQLWTSNRLIVPWVNDGVVCELDLVSNYDLENGFAMTCLDTCYLDYNNVSYNWTINGSDLFEENIILNGYSVYMAGDDSNFFGTEVILPTNMLNPYRNTVKAYLGGHIFNDNEDSSTSCFDETEIEIIAINCDGFMDSDAFNLAYYSTISSIFPSYTSNGFALEHNNNLEFFSGEMSLDASVNTIISNNNVVLYACNGIVLSDGFFTGDNSFETKVGDSYIESCENILNKSTSISYQDIENTDFSSPLLEIIPNPVLDNFAVYLTHNIDSYIILEIFDSQGRVIKSIKSLDVEASDYSFEVNNFNVKPGMYFCRYTNCLTSITIKFIKK